jgi:hypothetical protein
MNLRKKLAIAVGLEKQSSDACLSVFIRKFAASNWTLSIFVGGCAWQLICQASPWLLSSVDQKIMLSAIV